MAIVGMARVTVCQEIRYGRELVSNTAISLKKCWGPIVKRLNFGTTHGAYLP